mgnify:CR=1 FL=1
MFKIFKLERIYIWMAVFVVILTIFNMSRPSKEQYQEEKSISTKTFSEIGITEERVKDFLNSKGIFPNIFQYFISLGVTEITSSFILLS